MATTKYILPKTIDTALYPDYTIVHKQGGDNSEISYYHFPTGSVSDYSTLKEFENAVGIASNECQAKWYHLLSERLDHISIITTDVKILTERVGYYVNGELKKQVTLRNW